MWRGSIRAESDHAPSMKSIVRLMSVGRSTKIEVVGPAHVPSRVAGVIDRDGDETDLLSRVVVTQELTTPAIRDDDERELPAHDRTILGDGQNVWTDLHLARRFGARIPDRAIQRGKCAAGRNVDTLKSGPMGERGQETKEGSEGKADHLGCPWVRESARTGAWRT
jgi:hypothetical protein